MTGIAMSTTTYNQTLINWEALTLLPNRTVDFGDSTYTSGGAAEIARTNIENNDGWTILDGGGI